jgi:hypothetical protein
MKVKIYKEGEKSKGICEKCGEIVTTTFRYADLPYDGHIIPDVLQDFCDVCGTAVSIPHQSSYRIREFRQKLAKQQEVRVPKHYRDILLAIARTHRLGGEYNKACRILSELYLSRLAKPNHSKFFKRIRLALQDDLSRGKRKSRISCYLSEPSLVVLHNLENEYHMNYSDIVRGIIIAAKHDILDEEDTNILKELDEFAAKYA